MLTGGTFVIPRHIIRWKTTLAALPASAALTPGLTAADNDNRHDQDRNDGGKNVETRTPIKHVIVLIGENRTFDHVYGTYVPKHGQSVQNLLSKGIVNADGSPGPNMDDARQFQLSTINPV